jgi:PAS domain S-box-containing protein
MEIATGRLKHRDRICTMDCTLKPDQCLDTACSDALVYSINARFRLTSVSPNVESMLGHKPESLIDRPFQELGLLHPGDLNRAIADTVRLLCGEKILSSTYRFITRKGLGKLCEVGGVPLMRDNDAIGIIVVAKDTTGRRHLKNGIGNPGSCTGLRKGNHRTAAETFSGRQSLRDAPAGLRSDTLTSGKVGPGERQLDLEEMSIALKVLMRQQSNDRRNIEKNLVANIAVSLLPTLERLKTSGLREDQMQCVSEIENLLREIGSSFVRDLSSRHPGLSPSEVRVASLIRNGKSSKEIADLLHVSLNTVLFHRNNIRQKTGLKNTRGSLATYLQTFDRPEP